jgi:putative membrane protein
MNLKYKQRARVIAVLGGSALLAAAAAFPAVAATGDVDVVNTETVSIYTDASGKVDSKRLYEQLALTGNGAVDFANPIVSDGLRNLDGFGGFDVKDGVQQVNVEVDGEKNIRTVSNYDGDLPLDISIAYELDGEPIDPDDLVGKSGDLEVSYTVKNLTGQVETLSFDDGKGGTVEKEVEVIMPMVGSLTTTLPGNFRKVSSGEANVAGDGKGGTKLSFTMTLLAPVGSDTAEFGYTAQVDDAVVPDAAVTALPVNPLESPSFASAGKSYQGGAETGKTLAAGAATIDGNLLKLRDGAGELLAGLLQLRSGADQLSTGLNADAVPGSMQLADGADDLRDGLGQIDDGAGKLADGSNKLNDGAGKLRDGSGRLAAGSNDALAGSKKLTNGLGKLSNGLGELADKLPGADKGIEDLKAGVDKILAGLGDPTQPTTLIGGLTRLDAGLTLLAGGAGNLAGGMQNDLGGPLGTAQGGVDGVKGGLDQAIPNLDGLIGALNDLGANNPGCSADAVCRGTVANLALQVTGSKNSLSQASGVLAQVSAGLGNAIGAVNPGGPLYDGAMTLQAQIFNARDTGSTALLAGAQNTLKPGVQQVRDGLDELAVGITDAVAGVMQLSAGADDAYAGGGDLTAGLGTISGGAGDLADGAGELAAGTGELSAGAGELAAGTGDASDGSGLLADGAGTLADGLKTAADGSGQLADGLGEAAGGAPALVDGADRLSEEGTSKLVEAGEATAQEYGEMYATLEAGAERAQTDNMVVGAPEDAIGLSAYSYEIKGEDGEGGRNTVRALAGLAVLAAGAGVFALRRRFV